MQFSPAAEQPHNVEAEQAVLGGLLLDNNAYDRIAWLTPEAFYREDHREIYRAIQTILEAGKPCDVLLLSEALKTRGDLERFGGQPYLGSLALNTPSAANILNYAKLVHRRATLRKLGALAVDLQEAVNQGRADPQEIAESTADHALSILDAPERGDFVHIGDAVAEAVESIDSPIQGLSTGYSSLDRIIGGLRDGELIIVAGRPSMGKSALMHNIAEHVSVEHPVAAFSLEMVARQFGRRSYLWHEHLSDRSQAITRLFDHHLWIDDSSQLTLGTLRVRLQRMRRKHGLKMAVIDYLQLATGAGDNRTQEIGSLSRGLKALAKEFRIPIVVASQLNRGVEQRQDKRPMLSDLRESGEIEQDADVIIMLYRDDYYHPDSQHAGFAEAIVRKHRDGPTGTAWLTWVPEFTRFKDFVGAPPKAYAPAAPKTSGTVRRVGFGEMVTGNERA